MDGSFSPLTTFKVIPFPSDKVTTEGKEEGGTGEGEGVADPEATGLVIVLFFLPSGRPEGGLCLGRTAFWIVCAVDFTSTFNALEPGGQGCR